MATNNLSQKEKDIFARNFKLCLLNAGKTQSDIVQNIGVTSSTVSDWANAKKYPRVDKMQMIADYLGVLISDLREEKNPIDLEINGILKTIYSDERKLRLAKWIAGLDESGLDRFEKILDLVQKPIE